MSLTSSLGAVGPGHWTYMAAIIAEQLNRIITTKRIPPDDIPETARADALKFFRLVREAAGELVTENPSASINAYVIASDVLRSTAQTIPETHEDLTNYVEAYEKFIRDMNQPRMLKPRDVRIARSLRRFFRRLLQEGEADLYAESVHGKDQPSGFPLF